MYNMEEEADVGNGIVLYLDQAISILYLRFMPPYGKETKDIFIAHITPLITEKGFITLQDIYCQVGGYLLSIKNPTEVIMANLEDWKETRYRIETDSSVQNMYEIMIPFTEIDDEMKPNIPLKKILDSAEETLSTKTDDLKDAIHFKGHLKAENRDYIESILLDIIDCCSGIIRTLNENEAW